MPTSPVRVIAAETQPWLGSSRARPNRWFSRASFVESMHWMVSQRPVELAALIAHAEFKSPITQPMLTWVRTCPKSADDMSYKIHKLIDFAFSSTAKRRLEDEWRAHQSRLSFCRCCLQSRPPPVKLGSNQNRSRFSSFRKS